MNEALTRKLFDDFPRLFRNPLESSLQWGCECDDGWYGLIHDLAQAIETAAKDCGLAPDSVNWPQCRQVKEKHGILCFVVFAIAGHPDLSERISELRFAASERSAQICEYCGNPVSLDHSCQPACR